MKSASASTAGTLNAAYASDFGVWAGNIKDGNTMGLTITLPMCGGIPVMDTNSTRTAEPRSLTAALLLNDGPSECAGRVQ